MIFFYFSPKIFNCSDDEFLDLYKKSLDGEINQKLAFFMLGSFHAQLNSSFGNSLAIMKGEKLAKLLVFALLKNNMLFGHLNDIINRLHPMGITNHHIEYGQWIQNRPPPVEIEDPRRILSIYDLEFGFVIWLAACFGAFLVFLYEIRKSFLEMLKSFAAFLSFLRVLRIRLRHYNDLW